MTTYPTTVASGYRYSVVLFHVRRGPSGSFESTFTVNNATIASLLLLINSNCNQAIFVETCLLDSFLEAEAECSRLTITRGLGQHRQCPRWGHEARLDVAACGSLVRDVSSSSSWPLFAFYSAST